MKYENTYVVFDVTKGPKVIIETLDTYGKDGWELATIVTVGDTEQMVAFLRRRYDLVVDDPEEGKKSKISKLWGNSDE